MPFDSCAAAARYAAQSSSGIAAAVSGTYLIRSLANISDVALTHCDMDEMTMTTMKTQKQIDDRAGRAGRLPVQSCAPRSSRR
jgi:hypothetical protein